MLYSKSAEDMRKLKIHEFIENNDDWEKKLSEAPYFVSVSRKKVFGRNFMMLKYSQYNSDFTNPLVRECRGLILDEDNLEVISYAFDKFGNINESYIPELDAKTMKSTEKIDGSLIKIVKNDGNLLISTNGSILATDAPLPQEVGCVYKNFGKLVESILEAKFGNLENFTHHLKEKCTYMFELVSPFARVCTPYEDTDMYLIGFRDNITLKESFFWDIELSSYFKTPKILDFSSIEKCLEYAQTLDWKDEGFVVVDGCFNRIKVKNAAWLTVHHLGNNHIMSYERAIDIIKANELDEICSYFPEYKDKLMEIKTKYESLLEKLRVAWDNFRLRKDLENRKDVAFAIKEDFGKFSGVGFSLYDKRISDPIEWIEKCSSASLVKYLELKNE